MTKHLFVGGLVAAGFDARGKYLLVVSHAGRGVYSASNWERVARDTEVIYPDGGFVRGIGPISDMEIPVVEVDYDKPDFEFFSPDKLFRLHYKEGTLSVFTQNA